MRYTQRSSRATSLSCASVGAEVADLKVTVRDNVHVRLARSRQHHVRSDQGKCESGCLLTG